MMGYHHKFSKLPPCPSESGTVPATSRRPRFSRFELWLLVSLVVFATTVAVFNIIYLAQHRGTVNPAAITALCCTSCLLLVLAYIVSRRFQSPGWLSDVETASAPKWQISTPLPLSAASPLPAHLSETRQTTFDSKTPYPSSPGRFGLSSKVRLVVKKTFSSSLVSRSSIESSQSQTTPGDGEFLIQGDNRSSTDSSEDEAGDGLWTSVFELAGDPRLEQLRRANLKRLSRESRHSRYEMSGCGAMAAESPEIVVTKPEPIAPGSRRASWAYLREASLLFDPLRANPVRLSRDPSVRQTKSSQDLPAFLRDNDSGRRPRSAEPATDRIRFPSREPNTHSDYQTKLDARATRNTLPPLPESRLGAVKPSPTTAAGRPPRGLRKLPNPSHQNLRDVFKTGNELEIPR